MRNTLYGIFILFFLLVAAAKAGADQAIGTIVALKGKAVIERDRMVLDAKLKDGVQLIDTVGTKSASKTKMLFVDDSVLTVGENSSMVIKEFVYSKDGKGKAIFNLIDGKMRSVVGKTNFEVHTPTVVASTRGTVIYFETGIKDGIPYTTVVSLEGEVGIRSIDPAIAGTVILRPGTMVTVMQHKAPPAPSPAPQDVMKGAASMSKEKVGSSAPAISETLRTMTMLPQINQEPLQAIGNAPKTGSIRIGW